MHRRQHEEMGCAGDGALPLFHLSTINPQSSTNQNKQQESRTEHTCRSADIFLSHCNSSAARSASCSVQVSTTAHTYQMKDECLSSPRNIPYWQREIGEAV